jgi:RNA polymerase sigma factor (sigma-70 family)
MNGLTWLSENRSFVEWLCRISAKGQVDATDELWEVAIDKVQQICDTYDPDKGASLRTYLHRSLRWYMYKYMTARERRLQKHTSLDGVEHKFYSMTDNLCIRDEVYHIIRQLSETEVSLLTMHHVQDKTFAQMGQELGISTSSARNYYYVALQQARGLASRRPAD